MIGDFILHGVDEFAALPWDKLDPEECTQEWTFSEGGYGLEKETITISFFEGEIRHIWVLPSAIEAMFRIHSKCEAQNAIRKVKIALEIYDD